MFRIPLSRRAALPFALALSLTVSVAAYAQAPQPPTPTPNPGPQNPNPQNPRRPGRGNFPGGGAPTGEQPPVRQPLPPAKPRPYEDVVTKEAKTSVGLITTHQIDDRVLFEIPNEVFGKELLWVTTLRETQTGAGYGGQEVQDRVVRWEKRGDKILLRGVDYQARVGDPGMKESVALSTVEPILQVFNVAAYNKDKGDAAVIDMTSFLNGDPNEFSPRRVLNTTRIDPQRTFIERVKSLPQNVEMDILATYIAAPQTLPTLPGVPRPRREGPARDNSTDTVTAVVHHSLILLPEKPMMPRLADDRVGFFSTSFYDFGKVNRVKRITYIDRWRLEKKDPNAALSEPVKPITYYIGPEVPEKWRPYIKQGVEDWQAAFEKAGFKNAIICKMPPTKEEDPEFDPDDIRYSVIRWFPSATENAYGAHIRDPRSGEILNANPRFYYNVLKLAETWYFTQASPNDPKAQKLPLSDAQVGQLLRYVVSHEVGHTLGLRHNMKASSSFSIANLRDPKFTSEWGDEASIMDYGRFNYVAQPSDKVTRLIPKIGPYDLFAIEWGYKPVGATTPDGEKTALNLIASRQSKNPMLRFGGGPEGGITIDDPGQQSEDLGNDGIEATRLGLLNIDRVMGYLLAATEKPGENYDMLDEMYTAVVSQRERELGHVVRIVGGFTQTTTYYAQPEATSPDNFTPIPAARQRQAIQFLIANGLTVPKSLIVPGLLNRIEPSGVSDRLIASQNRILTSLLQDTRIKRMTDVEALYGSANVYPVSDLVSDLTKGVWGEVLAKSATPLTIDSYRRNLQRTFITLMGERLNGTQTDLRPLSRGALMDIKAGITATLPRTSDRLTRLHLIDCAQQIDQLLDPRK